MESFGSGLRAKIAIPMPALSEWQTLLAVEAGASATLTGLVFVAVSINMARILETPGLSGRAAESILQFLQVFFICTVVLVPGQPGAALAVEILVIALFSGVIQSLGHVRYARSRLGHPRFWLVTRILQTQFAAIPFMIAGIVMFFDVSAAIYWLVPGFVFSFVAGVANAWVLLIEILR